ncbi:MAG: chain-length determining protein [Sphingomonadaceae bacterium]|nr:chain-length determining protein [Sphingomonadaceae bacterium]
MSGLLDEFKVALHGIWQRRWLAMAVAWAVCLLGWLVVALIPNYYESHTRIKMEVTDVVPDANSNPLDDQRRIDQLRQELSSASNLAEVAVAAGMIDRSASEAERASAAAALQQATKVTATPDNIIDLTVSLGDGGRSGPEAAALVTRVVENVVSVFRDAQIRGGTADAAQTIRFLDQQITESQTKLSEAEQARAGFEARNLGLLPGAGSPAMRLESARAEMAQIDTQLIAVTSQLAATPQTMPGLPSTGIGVARQQLANAQAELAGMRARGLTAAHPDVIALNSQIAALRAQAAREPSGGGGAMSNPAYAGLVAQRNALQARRAQLAGDVANITAMRTREPAVAAEYDRLNREYNVLKDQNDRLVARREQVRLRGAAESNADAVRIDVLDPPTSPRAPTSPNKPLLVWAVLFAGLGAGLAAAFSISQIQTTYPTAARLARSSGLPVIGSVTEQLTDALRDARAQRLKRFAMAGAGLALLTTLLFALEIFQRMRVG